MKPLFYYWRKLQSISFCLRSLWKIAEKVYHFYRFSLLFFCFSMCNFFLTLFIIDIRFAWNHCKKAFAQNTQKTLDDATRRRSTTIHINCMCVCVDIFRRYSPFGFWQTESETHTQKKQRNVQQFRRVTFCKPYSYNRTINSNQQGSSFTSHQN